MTIELNRELENGAEVTVDVEVKLWPGSPGHCDRFGCPEEPDSPPEAEILSATCDGQDVELTEREVELVTEEAFAEYADAQCDYPERDDR